MNTINNQPIKPNTDQDIVQPWADIIIGALLLTMALTAYISSGAFAREELNFGPQFYPRLLSCFMGPLSIILIVRGISIKWRHHTSSEAHIAGQKNKRLALITFITLALYAAGIPVLGYIAATLLFLSVTIVMLGERRPLRIAVWTISVTFALYFVFQRILNVPLPGWFGS